MANRAEHEAAKAARIAAKELARAESREAIVNYCVARNQAPPAFRTDPVTARSHTTGSSRAIAERKAVHHKTIRAAINATNRVTDDLNDMPTAMREARRRETNDWLGQWQYEPAEMRKAMDKKLKANHAKYTEDMQFTQTGEPINPEYVLNAERHQIVNEKQKQAPEPERRTPKKQKWFARAWRWLTDAQGEGIKPMSVHEMQQIGNGKK